MLDDLKYIHHRDAQDALGIAEKQWQQLEQSFDVHADKQEFANIVFAGMGGSALAASISISWPGYTVPFEICRNYDLPDYVDESTLCIVSSYSGNTEETLAAFEQAIEKKASIAVITSGGKLADRAKEISAPLAMLPGGMQPRMATLSGLKALVTLLDAYGVTRGKADELADKVDFIKESVQDWLPTVPAEKNYAKQIAQESMGKSPVVYAGPKLYPAAYKWKISFNENAKNVAWCGQLPEFNHNEFLGWTSHPTQKPYVIIDLVSNLEHERVQKRFEITKRLLSGQRPSPMTVTAKGDDLLSQLLWVIVLGDFVSLYTALLNGLNPTPVDLIEKLKAALAE